MCSEEFSYYASNACTRGDEICTILIYEAMKWLIAHHCQFIYFGELHDSTASDQKLYQITRFKEGFSNTIFQGYSLEMIRETPSPSIAS